MKSPRKRTRPSQTPMVMYPRDIKRMKEGISDNVLTLVTAYLMDEFDYDDEKIVELWEGIARYSNAVEDHTITLKKVKQIIADNTGIKLLGYSHGRVETDQAE